MTPEIKSALNDLAASVERAGANAASALVQCQKLAELVDKNRNEYEAEVAALKDRIAAAEECCHRCERIVKGVH